MRKRGDGHDRPQRRADRCGFFAVNQMHGWRDAEGARIVAICDRDPERLKAVGDAFDIQRGYTSAEDLFADGGFDFRRHRHDRGSHRALVEMAAATRVATICQKPIAPTWRTPRQWSRLARNQAWRSWFTRISAGSRDTGGKGGDRQRRDRRGVLGADKLPIGFTTCSPAALSRNGKRFIIEDLGIHALDVARYIFVMRRR